MWCLPKKRRFYLNRNREKNKLTKKQKLGMLFAGFLLIIIGILFYLNYMVNPIIIQMSEAKIRSLATKAVGGAIYEVVSQDNVYNDLINVTYNNEGNITMIQANAIAINLLNRTLTRMAQTKLEEIGNQGINIPIGSFSGLPILVGKGPNINVKLIPIGAITSSFSSEFTYAGINQTNHKIYVNISSNISMVLPTTNQTIQTFTQVLICESIIIGKIPETYLQSDSLDEMLNLVPN